MKKIVVFILSVFMLFGITVTVYADDITHFEDGTINIIFMDNNITFDVPSGWNIQIDKSNNAIVLCPTDDILCVIGVADYESGDLADDLEDFFLKKAANETLEGVSGADLDDPAGTYELSNGESAGGGYYMAKDATYLGWSKRCGSYIFMMGVSAERNSYTDTLFSDTEMIMCSARPL